MSGTAFRENLILRRPHSGRLEGRTIFSKIATGTGGTISAPLTRRGDAPSAELDEPELCGCLRPGRLDPIRRRGRFVMAGAGVLPAPRLGNVADGQGGVAVRV